MLKCSCTDCEWFVGVKYAEDCNFPSGALNRSHLHWDACLGMTHQDTSGKCRMSPYDHGSMIADQGNQYHLSRKCASHHGVASTDIHGSEFGPDAARYPLAVP